MNINGMGSFGQEYSGLGGGVGFGISCCFSSRVFQFWVVGEFEVST